MVGQETGGRGMRTFASIRMGATRVSSYLGLANFAMLFGVVLRWAHGWAAPDVWFPGWMVGGYVLATIGVAVLAWIDRRFVWGHEQSISQSVNPMSRVQPLMVAWALEDMESNGVDVSGMREDLVDAFRMSGRDGDFRRFERMLRSNKEGSAMEEEGAGGPR